MAGSGFEHRANAEALRVRFFYPPQFSGNDTYAGFT